MQKKGRHTSKRKTDNNRSLSKKPKSSLKKSGLPANQKKTAKAEHWIWGWHAVYAALENPRRHLNTFIVHEKYRDTLPSLPVSVSMNTRWIADMAVLDKILPAQAVHQGIALNTPPLPILALEDIPSDYQGCIIMLDQIIDPHNVGAILRSCAAFNCRFLITQERYSPTISGVLARVASGALEKVQIIQVVNLAKTLRDLKTHGFETVGLCRQAGSIALSNHKSARKQVLVLGAEENGIRRLVQEACDILAYLPMSDEMESLNVSNAAAIALYEHYRNTSE